MGRHSGGILEATTYCTRILIRLTRTRAQVETRMRIGLLVSETLVYSTARVHMGGWDVAWCVVKPVFEMH